MHIKYLILFVTMMAYFSIHSMRMVLPQVDKYLIQYFYLDHYTLGIAHSCIYTIMGLGYLIQAIYPQKNIQLTYMIYVGIVAIALSMIGIYTFIGISSQIVLFITLGIFGFFQSTSWSTVATLMMRYFSPKRDGFAIGIWSTCSQLGNIFGFFIATLFIYNFNFAWQSILFVASFIALIFCIAVYLLPSSQEQRNQNVQQLSQNQNNIEALKYILTNLKAITPFYILFQMCLLKILVYGILLWIPLYLQKNGLKSFSGYIPIAFNVASLFGSSSLGNLYTKIQTNIRRHLFFFILNLVILLSFWILKIIDLSTQNQWALVFLLALMGFSLVGKYNNIVSNESFKFAEQNHFDPYIWNCVFEAIGYLSIGIFQLVIGIATNKHQHAIFVIFLVINFISLFTELLFCLYLYRKSGNTNISKQQQIDNQLQIQ